MTIETARCLRRPILIVDDDGDVRTHLSLLLQTHGYDVETASNGREAFDLLRRGIDPCLIILDIRVLYEGLKPGGRAELAWRLKSLPMIAYAGDPVLGKELGAGESFRKSVSAAIMSRLCDLAARTLSPVALTPHSPIRPESAARGETQKTFFVARGGLE